MAYLIRRVSATGRSARYRRFCLKLLLVAGIGLAGLVVAFPVGIGTALVLGTTLTYIIDSDGASPTLLFAGVAVGAQAPL